MRAAAESETRRLLRVLQLRVRPLSARATVGPLVLLTGVPPGPVDSPPTSPFVIASVSVAAAALVYAYVCEIRMDSAARRVRAWLVEARPEAWADLNAVHRHALGGRIGLKALRKGRLADDDDLAARYAEVEALGHRKLLGMLIGGLGIGVAIAGSVLFGWTW